MASDHFLAHSSQVRPSLCECASRRPMHLPSFASRGLVHNLRLHSAASKTWSTHGDDGLDELHDPQCLCRRRRYPSTSPSLAMVLLAYGINIINWPRFQLLPQTSRAHSCGVLSMRGRCMTSWTSLPKTVSLRKVGATFRIDR